MQFSTVLVAFLASTVTANLHSLLHCLDFNTSILGAGTSTADFNDDATVAACNAYKTRNTGPNAWDTCPDCTVIQDNQVKGCQSAASHLGGDQFLDYCKQFGANASQ